MLFHPPNNIARELPSFSGGTGGIRHDSVHTLKSACKSHEWLPMTALLRKERGWIYSAFRLSVWAVIRYVDQAYYAIATWRVAPMCRPCQFVNLSQAVGKVDSCPD